MVEPDLLDKGLPGKVVAEAEAVEHLENPQKLQHGDEQLSALSVEELKAKIANIDSMLSLLQEETHEDSAAEASTEASTEASAEASAETSTGTSAENSVVTSEASSPLAGVPTGADASAEASAPLTGAGAGAPLAEASAPEVAAGASADPLATPSGSSLTEAVIASATSAVASAQGLPAPTKDALAAAASVTMKAAVIIEPLKVAAAVAGGAASPASVIASNAHVSSTDIQDIQVTTKAKISDLSMEKKSTEENLKQVSEALKSNTMAAGNVNLKLEEQTNTDEIELGELQERLNGQAVHQDLLSNKLDLIENRLNTMESQVGLAPPTTEKASTGSLGSKTLFKAVAANGF